MGRKESDQNLLYSFYRLTVNQPHSILMHLQM